MKFRNLEIYVDYGKADISLIRNFEQVFGIKLPKLYIELCLNHNAPSIKNNSITYYDFYNDEEGMTSIGFDAFINEEDFDGYSMSNILRQYICDDSIYGYEHVYSFGSSANGDWICFDYRDNPVGDEPKICIVIHDEYDKKTGKHLLFPIADNFEQFLDKLKTFDEVMAKYE